MSVYTLLKDPEVSYKDILTTPVRTKATSHKHGRWAVWFFRAFMPIPFIFMAPDVYEAISHGPGSVHVKILAQASNDVLGNGAIIFFMLMLAISPIAVMTGWRWHKILRRDFGRVVFLIAAFDLSLASTTETARIHGGLLTRTVGHTFVLSGTLAVLLMLPLFLTSNKRSERWMGKNWITLQRLTYVVWALILLHMGVLFGFRSFFFNALEASVPLFILHLPPVDRWWVRNRKAHTEVVGRRLAGTLLSGVFIAAMIPFFHEMAATGYGAFIQSPGG